MSDDEIREAAEVFFAHLAEENNGPTGEEYIRILRIVLEETEIEITATKEMM